jgi:uroporphyrinogen-III synthase
MRVLVTRPIEAARSTEVALASLGHDAVVAPVLEIVRTRDAPPQGHFDGIVVTSRQALPALHEIADLVAGTPIFAVGQQTGRALRESGLEQVSVAGPDAAMLARFLADRMPRGARLLHVCGRDRTAEPAATLASAGLVVTVWETYAAQALDELPGAAATALAAGTLDAALHFSSRSAAIAARLVEQAGLAAPFAALLHVALSADVAAV